MKFVPVKYTIMNEDEKQNEEREKLALLPGIRFVADVMGVIICVLCGIMLWLSCGSPYVAVLPVLCAFAYTVLVLYFLLAGVFFANYTQSAAAAFSAAVVLLLLGGFYALGWPEPFGVVALAVLTVVAATFIAGSGACYLRRGGRSR